MEMLTGWHSARQMDLRKHLGFEMEKTKDWWKDWWMVIWKDWMKERRSVMRLVKPMRSDSGREKMKERQKGLRKR